MKLKKIFIWLLAVMVYLNTGWMIGTYYHNQVKYVEPTPATAKILAGGWGLLSPNTPESERNSLLVDQFLSSLTWSAVLILVILTWVAFGVWQILCAVWLVVKFLLHLTFAGGLAELVGTNGMIAIAWIIGGILTIYVMNEADKISDAGEGKWLRTGPEKIIRCLFGVVAAPLSFFFVGLPALCELVILRRRNRSKTPTASSVSRRRRKTH